MRSNYLTIQKMFMRLWAATILCALSSAVIAAPGDILFSDDFEAGFGNWTADVGTAGGVNTDTANSGTQSMFTRHQAVINTMNNVVDMAVPGADLSIWVRRGQDAFSEDPDNDEDLIIEFMDSIGVWVNLLTYPGNGTAGEIFTDTVALPFAALHANFQLRVRQIAGSGADFDYWHIDDIIITETSVSQPPLALGVCDYFEKGLSNWVITRVTGFAGISTATALSPTQSMHTNGGIVTVTSNSLDTTSAQFSGVSMWIRRGADAFSEDPDGGENLVLEYLDTTLTWVALETFNGAGAQGQIFVRSYTIAGGDFPTDPQHAAFQLRFRQVAGNNGFFDFWHMDDVCIDGTVAFPAMVVYKSVTLEDDPVNATNPKSIPLSNSFYRIRIANGGAGSPDAGTIVIVDDIPVGVELFTGNYSAGSPYAFVDGAGGDASGLTCPFVALGDGGDCITFLDSGSNPITPNGSYDSNVTSIEFRPAGVMNPATGTNTPYFDIEFRVRVLSP